MPGAPIVASLLLVAMPGAPIVASLLLVAMPGAPSSVLAPIVALVPTRWLWLFVEVIT